MKLIERKVLTVGQYPQAKQVSLAQSCCCDFQSLGPMHPTYRVADLSPIMLYQAAGLQCRLEDGLVHTALSKCKNFMKSFSSPAKCTSQSMNRAIFLSFSSMRARSNPCLFGVYSVLFAWLQLHVPLPFSRFLFKSFCSLSCC